MHYNIGDQVVVRIVDTNQIGIITNIRKKKNQIIGYDLRTERGNAFVVVQVDKPKSTYSIDSQLTSFWGLHSDQPSNLHININCQLFYMYLHTNITC